MYAGEIVELATPSELFANLEHPYTQALLRSSPRIDQPSHMRLQAIGGRPPDLRESADGVSIRTALPAGAGPVHQRASAVATPGRDRGRPRRGVPLPGRDPRGRCRAGRQSRARCSRTRRMPPTARPATPRRARPRTGAGADGGIGTRSPATGRRHAPRRADLVVEFPIGPPGPGRCARSRDVSLDVPPGETLGRRRRIGVRQVDDAAPIMQLLAPTSGSVSSTVRSCEAFTTPISVASHDTCRLVFQDPISSLNPRRTVRGPGRRGP